MMVSVCGDVSKINLKCQFSPSISSISTTPYQQTNKGQMESFSKNGGQHTAACVCLQRELDRPLLWFACRRHVGEVMLSDCWDSLNIEASSWPKYFNFY
ncbi:hypothetical protein Avbf_01726 [Armadillidium vulgare]|nr:hypothetical protein Avbf_01726 [Armadillidium vulgare]